MINYKSKPLFDSIIFYYWLPEEELNSIFIGMHKWWFSHGLGYDRCVFYGPAIKSFKSFKSSERITYTIPSDKIQFKNLREFLTKQDISKNPILSIVVEGDRLPDPVELASASMPIQCFVADTHHMTNSLTSAILFVKKVDASMVFVSHSPHRKIFADCINQDVYPLVYTPNDTFGAVLNRTDKIDFQTCYYGTVEDIFHPERTYYLKKILETGESSVNLKLKPRMQPRTWLESLSKDLASFTCSLNGFPSVQSYAPFLGGTCLVTDSLSQKSDLGPHLKHEENCLIYRNESEAINLLAWIKSNPKDARQIANKGRALLHQITPTIEKSLEFYCINTNKLYENISNVSESTTRIQLGCHALTACYAYEIIQELHRFCKQLLISINGETEVSTYLKDYLSILPRVDISEKFPIELPRISEGECVIGIINPGAKDTEGGLDSKKILVLRITQQTNEYAFSERRSGKWINPCSYIDCDFAGKQFPQFIPENILLVETEKNEAYKRSRSTIELLQQVGELTSEAAKEFLPPCVNLCINDIEALEVADACDAAGLADARKEALMRAVFLNRDCVPALIQLADLSLEAGAPVDAALLLSEADRVQPLPEAIAPVFRELMEKVSGAPPLLEYRRALAGGEHPEPKALRRILVVTNLFPPQEMGGYGRKIWEFANGLKERGHAVEVWTSNSDYLGKKPDESEFALESVVRRELVLMGEWKGGKTHVTTDAAGQKRMGEANARKVLEAVRHFKPDAVLLGNLDFLGVELLQWLLKRGIPVVHSLGNQSPWYQPGDSIDSPLYVIAPASDWLGRNLISLGYKAPRMQTVYPGARVDRFYRFFLPDARRLRIAFAGLVMHYKGPHVLLDALVKLQQAGIDFQAEIAGDSITPDFVDQLKRAAEYHGISDRVKFTGFLSRTELMALFARSNMLVFPTLVPEAFGISQVEAMAGGLIVLTSGTGGTTEVVRHLEDGIVFDLNDPGSLANWLRQLACDPALRQRLQTNARERALNFSVTGSVVVIERIVENLLSGISGKTVDVSSGSESGAFAKGSTPVSATLETAVSAFQAGRLAEAEDVCRELLQGDEKCAGAWGLLARLALLHGDLETAQDFATVACDLETGSAEFARILAEIFLQRGELEQVGERLRLVLEIDADDVDGLVLLGRLLTEKGEKGGAFNAFERALRLRKDDTEVLSHYSTALQKFDCGKDAVSQMRKAVSLSPESVELNTKLAMVLEQNARYVDALAAYGKASRLNPDVGFVWFRQGKLLNGLKRYAEAMPALEKAVALPGATGEMHYELGIAKHLNKRFPEALEQYEKAIAFGYETAALHCNRGVILKDLRRGGDAIMAFHTAVKMDPSNVSYLNNLGAAALEIGLNTEALDCFEEAARQNPKLPTAQNNIGNLLKDRARGHDALPHYRKAMELAPEDRDAPSNFLLCHMYLAGMDPKTVFEEHRKWGLATVKRLPPSFKFKSRERGSKLRVGFVSADLCHHPVAHFIEPIFRHYDKSRFEFFAYGDQRKSDEFSERLSTLVDHWSETCSFDDRALAKKIHSDRVDILFELAGHTAYNRLGVFALKPSPVQATYLGYPGTTGLPTIDFRITDVHADPPGMTECFYTEKLLRLPHSAWCYEPESVTPDVVSPPMERNGYVTFGCFNNMAKLNPALFEMWAEILKRVPGSHLRLKARMLADKGVCEELRGHFEKHGVDVERLELFGHVRGSLKHMANYNEVDVALDSFPYHGTTTTCEAMWMGVPVVTRAGATHVSRVGVSLLNTVGLQEFISDSRDAYISKAVELAESPARLAEMRPTMRGRMKGSLLMDGERFAKDFAAALEEMALKL